MDGQAVGGRVFVFMTAMLCSGGTLYAARSVATDASMESEQAWRTIGKTWMAGAAYLGMAVTVCTQPMRRAKSIFLMLATSFLVCISLDSADKEAARAGIVGAQAGMLLGAPCVGGFMFVVGILAAGNALSAVGEWRQASRDEEPARTTRSNGESILSFPTGGST